MLVWSLYACSGVAVLVMNAFLPPNSVTAEQIVLCSFFCIIHVEQFGNLVIYSKRILTPVFYVYWKLFRVQKRNISWMCTTNSVKTKLPCSFDKYRSFYTPDRIILHLHISHNAPSLPPQILNNLCFLISPGYYSRPKRNWKQCFIGKILGDK